MPCAATTLRVNELTVHRWTLHLQSHPFNCITEYFSHKWCARLMTGMLYFSNIYVSNCSLFSISKNIHWWWSKIFFFVLDKNRTLCRTDIFLNVHWNIKCFCLTIRKSNLFDNKTLAFWLTLALPTPDIENNKLYHLSKILHRHPKRNHRRPQLGLVWNIVHLIALSVVVFLNH